MSIKKIILGIINVAVRVAILIFVFSLIKKVCLTSYDYGYRVFSEKAMTEGDGFDKEVVIPIGSSALDIGKILKNKGLIRDEKLFYIQVLLSSYRGKLNPGSYNLNTSMTAEDMMRVMAGADEPEEEDSDTSTATQGNSTVAKDVTSESGAIDEDVGLSGNEAQASEEEGSEGEGTEGEDTAEGPAVQPSEGE